MKKLMTALAICAVAGFALAQVNSANVVGYQSVMVQPGFNMFSLNWQPVGGGSMGIQSLFATNGLVGGLNTSDSDLIQIWNTGTSKFDGYYYHMYKASGSGKFTNGPAWVLVGGPLVPATATIVPGTGFWFSRPAAAGSGTVLLAGEVVGTSTATLMMTNGFNMVGSVFPQDCGLNTNTVSGTPFNWNTATAGLNTSDSDLIQVWNTGTGKFDGYYYHMYKASGSGKFTNGPAWVLVGGPLVVSTNVIPMGTGFWYVKAGSSSANIVETSPIK